MARGQQDNRNNREYDENAAGLAWIKKQPLWAKISMAAVFLICIAAGIFMAVQQGQGCGCPAQFVTFDSTADDDGIGCDCNGDVFNCKWTCPDNVIYCGLTPCGAAPGSGSVVCPGKTEADFCNCSPGDCAEFSSAGSNCGCAAANACCGRGNATRLRA